MKAPYSLQKRGKIWYYRLGSDPKRTARSTGKKLKREAVEYVESMVLHLATDGSRMTLAEYARDFYIWDEGKAPLCPHCLNKLSVGGQISVEHAKHQRSILKRFLLGNEENNADPMSRMKMGEIRRGDCIDFRNRLVKRLNVDIGDRSAVVGKRTLNSAITVLSTIMSYALERQDIEMNPATKLTIRYTPAKRDIFTENELRLLFPADVADSGPWDDLRIKTMFLTAMTCGMRRGEVQALRWNRIDLENRTIRIDKAIKEGKKEGMPKWDKTRETGLPAPAARHLLALKSSSASTSEENYVFGNVDGTILGTELWENAWNRGLNASDIEVGDRSLVPPKTAKWFRVLTEAEIKTDLLGTSTDKFLLRREDAVRIADCLRTKARESRTPSASMSGSRHSADDKRGIRNVDVTMSALVTCLV